MAGGCTLGIYRNFYGFCDHRVYGWPHFITYYAGVGAGQRCRFRMVVLASAYYPDFSALSGASGTYGLDFWSV